MRKKRPGSRRRRRKRPETGDRVRHGKFGEGMVLESDEKTVTVMFDSVGQKKLKLRGIARWKRYDETGGEVKRMREEKTARLKEPAQSCLTEASRAYYQRAAIMTNYEYDALYDELSELEKETGTVLASSPTVNVGYEVLSDLPKEAHPQRMLS